MKAVLFCRVSSKEQEETGYSLPAQEKLLRSYADKNSFKIGKIFSISESASGHKQREIFTQMIRFVQKQQIEIVVCEKTDRLTRNFKDMVMIDEWLDKDEKRQVHLVKDALVLSKNSRSQEKLNWGIRILFAKNYIDNLSEEVKKGQKEKLAQGWLPTVPPIGYKSVGEKGHKIHVIDEGKAPLVKEMFRLYATGNYSIKALTKVMHQKGLRNRNGSKIVKSRLHQYLTDPFYIGYNKWNNKQHPGKQEKFISKELFEKVQEVLKSKTTPKYRKHNFLFKSLLKCLECEGTITWEIQKGNVYGHCNHYRNCTQKVWSTEKQVEDQVIVALENLQIRNARLVEWLKKALKESHRETLEFYGSTINELNERLRILENRFERIYDDKLDGKITEEFYQSRFKTYTSEKEDVLEAIKSSSNANTRYYELSMNIYDLSQRGKEIYLKAKDTSHKRQLLRLVFDKISLDEGRVGYTYSKAFKLVHDAVIATNSSKVVKNEDSLKEIFELHKLFEITPQSDSLYDGRPTWLPG